jgi:hypothetical protein
MPVDWTFYKAGNGCASTHPLAGFIAHARAKHALIFPDTFSVLNHLFYVLGNGYDFDGARFRHTDYIRRKDGEYDKKVTFIDEVPILTGAKQKKFLQQCIAEDLKSCDEMWENTKHIFDDNEEWFAKREALHKAERAKLEAQGVNYPLPIDKEFGLPSMRQGLHRHRAKEGGDADVADLPRPYPFDTTGNSAYPPLAYKITDQAPYWLMELCREMHECWAQELEWQIREGFCKGGVNYGRPNTVEYVQSVVDSLRKEITRLNKMMKKKQA